MRTYEAEHVDKRCEGRNDKAVPSLVRLVHERVHGVPREGRNGDIRDVAERQLVVSTTVTSQRWHVKTRVKSLTLVSSSHLHLEHACLRTRHPFIFRHTKTVRPHIPFTSILYGSNVPWLGMIEMSTALVIYFGRGNQTCKFMLGSRTYDHVPSMLQ